MGGRQRGFSLTETLIALAITSLVVLGVSQYLDGLHRQARKQEAKDNTQKSITTLKRLIERDAQFMIPDPGSIDITNSGRKLTIRRFRTYDGVSAFNDNYDVSYETVCVRPHTSYEETFTKIYSDQTALINQASNVCLRSLTCSPGYHHQIQIETSTTGARIQRYDPRFFPSWDAQGLSLAGNSLGAALCANRVGDQVHVRIEAFYPVTAPNRGTQIQIVRSDLFFNSFQKQGFMTLPE